jgi:hypothetical protein
VPPAESNELWKRLQLPSSPEQMKIKILIHDIHGKLTNELFVGLQAVH